MKIKKTKILILEDVKSDVLLIEYQLNKSNFNYTSKAVKTKAEYLSALKHYKPDIILSDYNLPQFSGLEALFSALELSPNTPFIFVTGILDEKTAVGLLEKGAWDYLLKDNLLRLIPAVENALKLKNEKEKLLKTQKELKQTAEKYRDLYQHAPDMFFTFNFNTGVITECNQTLTDKIGYKKQDLIGHLILEFYPEDFLKSIKNKFVPIILKKGKIENGDIQIIKKDKSILYGNFNAGIESDTKGYITHIRLAVRDVTNIKIKEQALLESEERFKLIFDKSVDPILILNTDTESVPLIINANSAARALVRNAEKYVNKPVSLLIPHIPEKEIIKNIQRIHKGKTVREKITFKISENKVHYFDVIASFILLNNKKHILITARDITEQYQAELNLIKQKENFQALYEEYQSQNENLELTVQKLHKSKKALSKKIDIINRSPIVFFSWKNKAGWPVNYVSENVSELLGYSASDFINGNILYEQVIHPDDLPQVRKEKKNGSKDKSNFKITHKTYRVLTKDKKIKWVNDDTIIIRKNGKIINYEGIISDVSEDIQKNEQLNLLYSAINQSPSLVVVTDIRGDIQYTNPKFSEITGYSISEVIGKNPRILKSGKHDNLFYKNIWNIISNGEIWEGEFYNKKKNGELYWEKAIIKPVKDANGKITNYIAIKEDITEQKQIREKLIKSEMHFRLLFENSLIGMYLTTPEGHILDANKALYEMLGYESLDEFKKVNLENSDDFIVNRSEFKSKIETDGFVRGLESIWSDKNNQLIYIRENARKFTDESGNVFYEGTVENITKEKYAEKALREIHEFNKKIIRTGKLGYAIFEKNGKCVDANKTYAEILGTDVPVLLHSNFRENKNWKNSHLIEVAENTVEYGTHLKRIIKGESVYGKNVWIEYDFSRFYKENVPQLLILKDISSYMKAKRKQIQTKSEYLKLIQNVNVPIFGINLTGKIAEWNSAIENLTGYSRQEVKKIRLSKLFQEKGNETINIFMTEILKGKLVADREITIIGKTGQFFRLLISSSLQVNDDDKIKGIIFIAQDITQKEKYKEELEKQIQERTHELIFALKKEKELSELKSQFVSMASHEFRTPLSAIKFAAGFIYKYYDKAEKLQIEQKAKKIETQVNHMTGLLEDVLTIGKIENGKMKFNPNQLNLIEIVRTIKEDIETATKNTHKINFTHNIPEFKMISDEKILRNIFINLLSNAIKFSPDADEISLKIQAEENDLFIEVQDKGIGIKQEELKDIFSPFKRGNNVETIQGTGLGLAIVKESVNLLKGKISVESTEGKGTKFNIILPKFPENENFKL